METEVKSAWWKSLDLRHLIYKFAVGWGPFIVPLGAAAEFAEARGGDWVGWLQGATLEIVGISAAHTALTRVRKEAKGISIAAWALLGLYFVVGFGSVWRATDIETASIFVLSIVSYSVMAIYNHRSENSVASEVRSKANSTLRELRKKLKQAELELDSVRTRLAETELELNSARTRLSDSEQRRTKTELELDSVRTRFSDTELELNSVRTQFGDSEQHRTDTELELDSVRTRLTETELELNSVRSSMEALNSNSGLPELVSDRVAAAVRYSAKEIELVEALAMAGVSKTTFYNDVRIMVSPNGKE